MWDTVYAAILILKWFVVICGEVSERGLGPRVLYAILTSWAMPLLWSGDQLKQAIKYSRVGGLQTEWVWTQSHLSPTHDEAVSYFDPG